MCTICSGEVSDAACYWAAEIHMLEEWSKDLFGCVAFYRFKDDIFAAFQGPRSDPSAFFKARAGYAEACFEIEFESMSREGAVFT